jgi:hypothetical protein
MPEDELPPLKGKKQERYPAIEKFLMPDPFPKVVGKKGKKKK